MSDNGCSLRHIIDKHILNHTKRIKNCHDMVSLQREEECHIRGNLRLCGGPHWSIVIEDSSFRLPCVIINKAGYLIKLINLLGCLVEIAKGFIVIESCQPFNEMDTYVYLQFSPSDATLLKTPRITSFEIVSEHWDQRILVVHSSLPIIIKNVLAFCLVLVMIMNNNEGNESKYLWIVLKGSQVAWTDFLIPNREYILHMPVSMDYFETTIKPLRAVLGKVKGIPVFKEVIHHPEFWPTLNATELPIDTTISVGSSINRNVFNCQISSAWWLSISEALALTNSPIVTIWGEVIRVTHSTTEERDGCSLCTKQNFLKELDDDIPAPDQQSWMNPWDTKLIINETLAIPNVDDYEPSGTIFPEQLTKVITLKDVKSGKTVTLYLKKWLSRHYSCVFTPGVILCAKYLHKRISAKQIPYFVTCALSNFEVVSNVSTIREVISTSSIKYGFPFLPTKPGDILWGILDQWSLLSVSLKYDYNNSFSHDGKNSFSKPKFNASAIVHCERHTNASINIILKNEQVKLLLEIPDDVWLSLSIVSRKTPLFYSSRGVDLLEETYTDIEQIFYAFCETRNVNKKRFHVSCRLLQPKPGEDEMFFCTSIGDADPEHLLNLSKPNLLSELLNKSLKL